MRWRRDYSYVCARERLRMWGCVRTCVHATRSHHHAPPLCSTTAPHDARAGSCAMPPRTRGCGRGRCRAFCVCARSISTGRCSQPAPPLSLPGRATRAVDRRVDGFLRRTVRESRPRWPNKSPRPLWGGGFHEGRLPPSALTEDFKSSRQQALVGKVQQPLESGTCSA